MQDGEVLAFIQNLNLQFIVNPYFKLKLKVPRVLKEKMLLNKIWDFVHLFIANTHLS